MGGYVSGGRSEDQLALPVDTFIIFLCSVDFSWKFWSQADKVLRDFLLLCHAIFWVVAFNKFSATLSSATYVSFCSGKYVP